MYQMSQSYSIAPKGGLETIAYSSSSSYQGSVAYAAAAIPFQTYQPIISFTPRSQRMYSITETLQQAYQHSQKPHYHIFQAQKEYHFTPEIFLKPGDHGSFVGKAEEIREFVEETFEKLFQLPFPQDIKISVLEEKEFRKLAPSPATIGLSINRRKYGLLSEIFVRQDYLARVLLTIGHELGHVLTDTLDNAHDEEAKAYAFSLAWMKMIQEHNIAKLQDVIVTENPAQNGLHNVAFDFVSKLLREGKQAWAIYSALIREVLKINVLKEI